ncbi:hypothetical protein LCGC14_1438190 [marine sediment metagenome]|uniref:Uncharacterized protein n=1 Tax=marine sediment metagenome TaxID=412755 RepID=A0A0F9K7N9_9ZZZZ
MAKKKTEVVLDRCTVCGFMGRYTVAELKGETLLAGDKFVTVDADSPVPEEESPLPAGW